MGLDDALPFRHPVGQCGARFGVAGFRGQRHGHHVFTRTPEVRLGDRLAYLRIRSLPRVSLNGHRDARVRGLREALAHVGVLGVFTGVRPDDLFGIRRRCDKSCLDLCRRGGVFGLLVGFSASGEHERRGSSDHDRPGSHVVVGY